MTFEPVELTNGVSTLTALTAVEYTQRIWDGWVPIGGGAVINPAYEPFIDRGSALPGQVAVLQEDGSILFEAASAAAGVSTVNGESGDVVLDADDIGDGVAKVTMTIEERTKLGGVADGATVNATDAELRDRATHTGIQAASTISDLTEATQDIVAAFLLAGTGVTVTYDDVANTFTINATGGGGGTTDPEIVRDVIGTALVAGSGVQITLNDAGDTITIASTAVLPTRQVIAGTGLTGGGDLSADRTLAVQYGATAGTAVQGNDTRVTADQASGTASIRTLGTGATQAAAGSHTHTADGISDATTTGKAVIRATDAAAARTAIGAGTSSLALGTTGATAAAGDHTHTDKLGIVAGSGLADAHKLTQAAYDALGAGRPSGRIYFIVG